MQRKTKGDRDMKIRGRYEVYDCNDEVIDDLDDLKLAQVSAEYDNAKFILDTKSNKVVWGKTDD